MKKLLSASALALVLSVSAASAAEVFKVGLIASYTGAFATWGTQFQNAIDAYQAIYGKTVKGPKGEDLIRLRAGPFPAREDADRAQYALKSAGLVAGTVAQR